MINPFSSPQIAAELAATITKITASTSLDFDITVPGATPEMTFLVTPPSSLDAGVGIGGAWGKAGGGKVTVRFINATAGDITPGAKTFKILGF